MQAVYAGLIAWFIEVSVLVSMVLILRHEENKVYNRRKKSKHN